MEKCPFPFLVEKALKKVEVNAKTREIERQGNVSTLFMLRRNLKALVLQNEKLREENKRLREVIQRKEREILRLREDNAILRSLVRKLKKKRKIF